ncbi:hypothetical protein SDC9_52681 [bioreactor metagenome]|uniref:Uncharacterized protein n=1 Tax=bioreactor metagenome TaxID=1076179 RepID=A0A644WRL1_9ZZZZ
MPRAFVDFGIVENGVVILRGELQGKRLHRVARLHRIHPEPAGFMGDIVGSNDEPTGVKDVKQILIVVYNARNDDLNTALPVRGKFLQFGVQLAQQGGMLGLIHKIGAF